MQIRTIVPLLWLLAFFLAPSVKANSGPGHFQASTPEVKNQSEAPLRIGVVGLVHSHVHGILGRADKGDIQIVGIAEPNRELALRYSRQYGFSMDLVFETLDGMVRATKPEAVTVFTSIYDHLATVSYCAPKGIHVMVEKPLAASLDHANQMVALAEKHKIWLLTNYETTWYGSNALADQKLHHDSVLGDLRRIVFHTGHFGPVEIGCEPEFLEWLTDPVQNGGGALMDFGCYGANLSTWFMRGNPPLSVSCTTQQLKPHLYPRVDDDATIVLTYPNAQVIIQASWNWPHHVKDMEMYGTEGYLIAKNATDFGLSTSEHKSGSLAMEKAPQLEPGLDDPFSLLHQVVRGIRKPEPFSPSSLENNLIVMQILEAAKQSAASGKVVMWSDIHK